MFELQANTDTWWSELGIIEPIDVNMNLDDDLLGQNFIVYDFVLEYDNLKHAKCKMQHENDRVADCAEGYVERCDKNYVADCDIIVKKHRKSCNMCQTHTTPQWRFVKGYFLCNRCGVKLMRFNKQK